MCQNWFSLSPTHPNTSHSLCAAHTHMHLYLCEDFLGHDEFRSWGGGGAEERNSMTESYPQADLWEPHSMSSDLWREDFSAFLGAVCMACTLYRCTCVSVTISDCRCWVVCTQFAPLVASNICFGVVVPLGCFSIGFPQAGPKAVTSPWLC